VKIHYLNTDLDLAADDDLTLLAAIFEAQGVPAFHVTCGGDGRWYATFETKRQFDEPEPNIAAMLDVVESLSGPARRLWRACTRREFNIGYDCGSEPRCFNHGLSSQTLGRMAKAGASLRITLYPPESASKPG